MSIGRAIPPCFSECSVYSFQLCVLPYSRLQPSIYVTPRCLDLFQKPPSSEGFPIG